MIRKTEKKQIRSRIHDRIRRKLRGTTERPRLAVFRSVAHIYAQVIEPTSKARSPRSCWVIRTQSKSFCRMGWI